ncbi:ATP-binding protein [candidate division Kazan bacterium]|uniref:ATP-binding protein n=1 Tax=candidate division Kazan bacterium TaxID=2202143 RepID=A0A420ZCN5_UNCK3|nr:MAG: ATP-binding protein [candidate division Kazan bacterium]
MEREQIARYLQGELRRMPELAEGMTQRNGIPFNYRSLYFRLKKRIDDFLKGSEERLVIIPGLRGVGKTTILFQLYNYLIKDKGIKQERVLVLFADELKKYFDAEILDAVRVFVEDIMKTDLPTLKERIFIIIDETHFDKEWDSGVKIIYDKTKNIFLLVTGSSALSMEMSADVARRSVKEPLFPLNFSEYLILKHRFFSEKHTASTVRNLIFEPSEKTIKQASDLWHNLQRDSIRKGADLWREFDFFLMKGGFPFAIHTEDKLSYECITGMIERIVEKDILTLHSFTTETRNLITRIIYFLAAQKPGGTSDAKLSQRFGASSRLIRGILDILEKTHLIFSVKPYGGAGKLVRKPWKYYFLSPSISAAIRYKLGLLDILDRDMLGCLAEGLVASTLFRINETIQRIGIFYDPEKEGVDFLIQKGAGELIPVEVGIGKKDKIQIKRAIKRYNSTHGIVISNTSEIKRVNRIIYIPMVFFGFA